MYKENVMHGQFKSGTLADGNAAYISMLEAPLPATVWTTPVAGDTVSVWYSVDNGVTYNAWPNGAVTAFAKDTLLSGVTSLKFQRTAGSGTTSTYGVC